MADLPLIGLDDAGRWQLATDAQQWIIASRNAADGSAGKARKFTPRSTLLHHLMAGLGIEATAEARAMIDGLSTTHGAWRHGTVAGRAAMAALAEQARAMMAAARASRFEGPANRELGRRGDVLIAPVGEGPIPARPAPAALAAHAPCHGPLHQVP
ncbi:MAG: hypothetical protein WD673_01695 [Alphaproteobacteria bacterium]